MHILNITCLHLADNNKIHAYEGESKLDDF